MAQRLKPSYLRLDRTAEAVRFHGAAHIDSQAWIFMKM